MPAATAKILKLELYLKLFVMQYTIKPISSSPTAMSDQPTLLSVSAAMLRANVHGEPRAASCASGSTVGLDGGILFPTMPASAATARGTKAYIAKEMRTPP